MRCPPLREAHQVVLGRPIVERDDEIPMRTRHPLVGRTVLVQHHPRKRRTLAALADSQGETARRMPSSALV